MVFNKVLPVAGLAACLATGCADQEESLIVLHAPAWGDAGECIVDAGTETYLLGATLDTAFGTGYKMPAILFNNLQTQTAMMTNGGVDPSEMQLRDADVSLSMPQAPEIIDALAARDEAFVEFTQPLPGNSILGGERHAVAVDIVTPPASVALSEELVARYPDVNPKLTLIASVVFHAKRSGNTSGNIGVINARTFDFPLTICEGCLRSCASCPGGTCPPGLTDSDLVGGVCGNAQDFPLVPLICSDAPSG